MFPIPRFATAAAALLLLGTLAASAATAGPAARPEEFRYSWKLRGGLAWIARLKFPVSGFGALRTAPNGDNVAAELVIRGRERGDGMYVYRSEIDGSDLKTLMTYHGYEWEGRKRTERTRFDYDDGVARIRKEREDGVENKVKTLPAGDMRDVLTGIHFLRAKAGTFTGSLSTEIYSDGGVYAVVFKALGTQDLPIGGSLVASDAYEITAPPGRMAKKWPGGVKVWLSRDEQRVPLRIEIRQSVAAVQMDLITG